MTRIQPWTEEQLMVHEKVFEALVTKAVNQTVKKTIAALRADVLTAAAEPAPQVSYTALEGTVLASWEHYVNTEMFPFLAETFLMSAERVADAMTGAIGEVIERVTNTYARDFLQYAYNRMVFTGQELWEKIRGELVAGYEAGEGITQLAARLQDAAGLSLPRALTVARTEVISAANGGSYVQMLEAGFDEKVTKEWLATMDPRTRESHRHADNQTVDLTDGFSVDIYTNGVKTGMEELEFPGDPTGTPGNVINCRCALAFNFEDDEDEDEAMTAAFVEKKHPRDKDGKFKKKGAPDLYVKIPDTAPANTAPTAEKAAWIAAKKWDNITAGQKLAFINALDKDTWSKLPPELKTKIKDAPSTTSHPESKLLLENAIKDLPDVAEPDDDADTDVPRPTGGVVTKTGKAWKPGQEVPLKVQFLYNTSFEDGAIMAVRKDSNERLLWNGTTKKIERQTNKDGAWTTTEALSRGNFYKKYNDETGWTIPDTAEKKEQTTAPAAPAVAAGKPIALKVQVLYNAKYDAGQTIAEKVGSNERLIWNGKKIERQTWDGNAWNTTDTVTRGKAYQLWKDEDGWTTPTGAVGGTPGNQDDQNAAPEAPQAVLPAQSTPFETVTFLGADSATWDASLKKIGKALDDSNVPDGTLLYDSPSIKVTKHNDGVALMTVDDSNKTLMYPDDFNENDFGVISIQTKMGNPPVPVPGSVPAAPAKKVEALDDQIADWKAGDIDDFSIGDTMFEDADIEIEKLNAAKVLVTSKHTKDFTGIDLDDLSAEKIEDFKELNAPASAPPPTAPTAVSSVSAEAQDAYENFLNAPDHMATFIAKDVNGTNAKKSSLGNVLLIGPNGEVGGIAKADVTPENLDKGFTAINAGLEWTYGDPIPVPVPVPAPDPADQNLTVTGKTLTPSVAPQTPLKMSYNLLVNPKTTKYTDGQVIAENPAEKEMLVWNGQTKKFNVYAKNDANTWVKIHTYTKQGAYKNLKDDPGWVTPAPSAAGAITPSAPAVAGNPSTPSFLTSMATALKPKFSVVELQAASDAKVSALTPDQIQSIYTEFRKPTVGGFGTTNLSSSAANVLTSVLRAQKDYHDKHPGSTLNMLEILRAIDTQAAKDAGVANKGLFEKKIVDWLGTPEGKKSAPQVLHEFRLSPAEKAQIEADKKAAAKAELDAKLGDFTKVTEALSKPSTTSTEFKVQSTASAQAAQDVMLSGAPWTTAQKASLKKYTGSYYYTLNGMLRGTVTPTDEYIKDAINIQKGMRPLSADMLLYRGTGAIPGVLPGTIGEYNTLIGKTFVEPGFSSTSITNPFGGKVKLEIEAPKGTAAAYVRSLSHFTSENEVLLAANTKFEILSAKEQGHQIVVRVRVVP